MKSVIATTLFFMLILPVMQNYSSASVATQTSTTPIKHIVVLFQENVSFDHYFGIYPNAANPPGEPHFLASPSTPSVNGLDTLGLLSGNRNVANPFRLDRSNAMTCDMRHAYRAEQQAYNGGLVDKFVQFTGSSASGCSPNQVMGYFDGNTVTALWNYAQHFAMSDNFYASTFGPSSVGAINVVSGQTHGAMPNNIRGIVVNGTLISDSDPKYDDCSNGITINMKGKNIGNLLDAKNLTWGWFQGGFRPTNRTAVADGTIMAICGSIHINIGGHRIKDYVAHHEPFQYYQSTANPHHLPPTSVRVIGHTDQANHQYDLSDFWAAARAGNLPAVSFLKAAAYQDAHPQNSDPLDEQVFLVDTINRLQKLPEWNSTAVFVTYDESGGWYDHVMPPIVSRSNDPQQDALLGKKGLCGQPKPGEYNDRCGYGPRIPILVISSWAKANFVDHQISDQSSILRFVEDNWKLGRIGNQSLDAKAGSLFNMFDFSHTNPSKVSLDPKTGQLVPRTT